MVSAGSGGPWSVGALRLSWPDSRYEQNVKAELGPPGATTWGSRIPQFTPTHPHRPLSPPHPFERQNGLWLRSQWRYVPLIYIVRSSTFIGRAASRSPLPWRKTVRHARLTTGWFTGPSRCFPFWQELLGCYVVNAGEGEAGKKKCLGALDDYYECLHHKKEVRALLLIRILPSTPSV